MQITIIKVEVQNVKKYQVAELTYSDYRGETKHWKLISFSNPASFAVLKDAKAGESYEITTGKTTGKDGQEYTNWTSAVKVQGPPAAAADTQTPNGNVGGGGRQWVPDADRQRLIVKQSSLGHAIELIKHQGVQLGSNQEVFDLADQIVAYVYDVPTLEVADAA